MTLFVGLTGSIGMGKSTTAQMFRDREIPVHDSDAVVHQLYSGEAVGPVEAAFPGTAVDGKIDRRRLSQYVVGNEAAMKQLEAIVHPLVRQAELAFRETARDGGAALAVLDIPLLFETGGQDRVDAVVVVTAPASVQRQRVLDRPGMDEEKFENILSRQVADSEKRSRADFIIDTSQGMDSARQQVDDIIRQIEAGWTSGTQSDA